MRRRSMCAGSLRVSVPSSSTRPLVGSTRRLIMRSSVDLPDPEVPTITVIELRSTSKETSSTTVVASYCLLRFSTRIMRLPGQCGGGAIKHLDERIEQHRRREGERHDRDRSEEHQVDCVLADSLEDECPETAAAD